VEENVSLFSDACKLPQNFYLCA